MPREPACEKTHDKAAHYIDAERAPRPRSTQHLPRHAAELIAAKRAQGAADHNEKAVHGFPPMRQWAEEQGTGEDSALTALAYNHIHFCAAFG